MPLMDANDPELTQTQFMEALRDLIQDATVADLPDGNRLDVEVFHDRFDEQVPRQLAVIARFTNAAGQQRRQHMLLRVVDLSETDHNYDDGEPVD